VCCRRGLIGPSRGLDCGVSKAKSLTSCITIIVYLWIGSGAAPRGDGRAFAGVKIPVCCLLLRAVAASVLIWSHRRWTAAGKRAREIESGATISSTGNLTNARDRPGSDQDIGLSRCPASIQLSSLIFATEVVGLHPNGHEREASLVAAQNQARSRFASSVAVAAAGSGEGDQIVVSGRPSPHAANGDLVSTPGPAGLLEASCAAAGDSKEPMPALGVRSPPSRGKASRLLVRIRALDQPGPPPTGDRALTVS
jgi:hypothetical protein